MICLSQVANFAQTVKLNLHIHKAALDVKVTSKFFYSHLCISAPRKEEESGKNGVDLAMKDQNATSTVPVLFCPKK